MNVLLECQGSAVFAHRICCNALGNHQEQSYDKKGIWYAVEWNSYRYEDRILFDLALDAVREPKVLPTQVTADACSNPDLFWALRGGGGGSFAVVRGHTIEGSGPLLVRTHRLLHLTDLLARTGLVSL